MTVLREILPWSQERPAWQCDALRRLAVHGALGESDVRALTDICKCGHGLAEPQEVAPLDKQHLPDKAAGPPVALQSLFHQRGVNALAEDQTLNFAPGLTLVYGDNGAGKSGYTRILKTHAAHVDRRPSSATLSRGAHLLSRLWPSSTPLAASTGRVNGQARRMTR